MHELHIAQKIIETIAVEAKKSNIAKVRLAKLRIGRMAAFDKEQLEFALVSREKISSLEGMKFEIDEVPVRIKCNACSHEYSDRRFEEMEFAHQVAHAPALYIPPICPVCNSKNVQVISGSEMELTSILGE